MKRRRSRHGSSKLHLQQQDCEHPKCEAGSPGETTSLADLRPTSTLCSHHCQKEASLVLGETKQDHNPPLCVRVASDQALPRHLKENLRV